MNKIFQKYKSFFFVFSLIFSLVLTLAILFIIPPQDTSACSNSSSELRASCPPGTPGGIGWGIGHTLTKSCSCSTACPGRSCYCLSGGASCDPATAPSNCNCWCSCPCSNHKACIDCYSGATCSDSGCNGFPSNTCITWYSYSGVGYDPDCNSSNGGWCACQSEYQGSSSCGGSTPPSCSCPDPSTYCAGSEPDNGCGTKCPTGTKNDCPNPNTYCAGREPTNSCGVKCPRGTRLPSCPAPNTYCSGNEPDDGCGTKCPRGTKTPSCPAANTYCAGSEPDDGCGTKCPTGTKNDCPNPSTYCPGAEPTNSCGVRCPTGTKDCSPPAAPTNVTSTKTGLIDYMGTPDGQVTDPVPLTGYAVTGYINWSWSPSARATYYYVRTTSGYLLTGTSDTTIRQYYNGVNRGYIRTPVINSTGGIRLQACNDYGCSSVVYAYANIVIETPDQITCSNIANNGFSVKVRSSEAYSAGMRRAPEVLYRDKGAFTYLNSGNSGLRIQIKNPDSSVRSSGYNANWVNTGTSSTYFVTADHLTANEYLPADWTVTGLSPNTTYQVCAQARNQVTQYRPGPTINNWNCVTCTTLTCTVSCPASNTYCAGSEPDNGCGGKCPTGTKNDCPAANTYCKGAEPTN
ncbi:MAG: hypothetical protein PHN39_02030, partial [Candidatus Pacebacteria bacterium]|nr:hypothetical protein [Candidatus Paceibacterota bacterium]